MNFSPEDIKEIKRQDRLIHTAAISKREHGLKGYKTRNDYQRDYARILYSSAFRRLQGKMQILGIESSAFFRNRLTHSLEVAQIAKGIRMELNKNCKIENTLNDMFLLDAAALAHDIGHPAFGHKGERVLDEILISHRLRFEGNAQNFRVLRTLEKKDPEFTGLNLTYRTLLAINKYIVKEDAVPEDAKRKDLVKKFMYADDFDMLNSFREKNNLLKTRTLDVQIIELADDIAYAVHDLEDALSQRYFTIDELLYEMSTGYEDMTEADVESAVKQMTEIVEKAKKTAKKSSSYSNLQEYSQVFRKTLTSSLTNKFIMDVVLGNVSEKESKEHGTIEGQKELKLGESRALCKLLSKKIFSGVTRHPNIALYEGRGEVVIKSLHSLFTERQNLMPPDYRPTIDDDIVACRASADYIAGMMDSYAIDIYGDYLGKDFMSIDIHE